MKLPRILLAAGASGSGKTLITCGLLQALVNRGRKVASFKCGPDYIDPMFHSRVIGAKSRNLDTFFTDRNLTNYLLAKNGEGCEIAVMEGVMGYYDGVGGVFTKASAYDLADTTETPVILIVNSKGMSLSLAAYIKGFVEYKENSHIKGVIFNQMSPMLYPRMKTLVEEELGLKVLGYVPKVEDCVIESRHLGLVLPEEIPELKERLGRMAVVLEKSLDIDGILELAATAPEIESSNLNMGKRSDKNPESSEDKLSKTERLGKEYQISEICQIAGRGKDSFEEAFSYRLPETVRLAVADDEAFCFFYEDNFRLLEEMGAELVRFSPLHDAHLPENIHGLLLYGGYPELNGKALEANQSMRREIREAIENGMPCIAECGGFMYLHEQMEDMDGNFREMVGAINGKVFRTPRLTRFGYVTLHANGGHQVFGVNPGEIPAHEFHYFDSENCGDAFHASKPMSNRGWDCIHATETLMAGFPHLHYYGNPEVPKAFLTQCMNYSNYSGQVEALAAETVRT